MGDSFAGITVPEGKPGAVRDAAATFRGIAGGLHGVSGDLQSVPGLVSDWKGLGANAFHGTVPTNGSCISAAAEAMSTCAEAARTYAEELETAQEEAKAAIEEARDAQRRIDRAQADIESALSAQITASDQIVSANARLSSGAPDPGAMADLDAAGQALSAAQTAESDARRRLEQAQDDLERAQRRGERAEKDAEDAARAAAGAFEGVAGGSPAAAVFGGSPSAIEGDVLARVRAGDYSVLDEVPMNYLPEDTQRAIGAEVAKDADQAAVNEGDHSIEQMAGIVSRYQHDGEVATGFYNQLGGRGARDFSSNLSFFHHRGEGWDNPELVQLMAPFATLLGTATRSGGLQRGFTSGFLRHDISPRGRLGGHNELKAFVMAGDADNYSGRFLADVGNEILIMPLDPVNEDIPGHVDIAEHQDFMKYMAGNPEASGTLLAGHHGPDNHFSNAGALLLHGPRYTDDGEALGALVNAGAHELRDSNLSLANDAAHAVIQAAPPHVEHLGDKAKPALVTILDDHIVDFEYVAADRADAGIVDPPRGGIDGLTYEEGRGFLTALVGDDATRAPATTVVGERVADNIYRSAATDDSSYAYRAGVLSEMAVLATADADLDTAEREDTMNGLASTAADKLLALAPIDKVPGAGDLTNYVLGEIFPTDAAEKALEERVPAQMHAFADIKRLSVAAQVALGELPPEALRTIDSDGTVNVNFVNGPNNDQDVIRVDTDRDGEVDSNLEWDLDRDGRISADEREITERELYDATLGPGEAAYDGIVRLHSAEYQAANPPDIDELPLPDGLDNDNPNTFERVMAWPFDAEGEGTVSDGSQVVARQEDLRWDPVERVYRLPVESADGSRSELTYRMFDEEWKLARKDGDEWVAVG